MSILEIYTCLNLIEKFIDTRSKCLEPYFTTSINDIDGKLYTRPETAIKRVFVTFYNYPGYDSLFPIKTNFNAENTLHFFLQILILK